MICKQCEKNEVTRLVGLKICDSCYFINYCKAHPEKYKYRYKGNGGKALKRDSYICQSCGEKDKKKLLIHHLDINKQNNKLENLLTVCKKCHRSIYHKGGGKLKEGQWARKYKACIECGTTEKRNEGKGLCTSCYRKKGGYDKNREEYKREWYKNKKKTN